jgi:hypothetical protein
MKNILYILSITVFLALSSCKSTLITQHVTTEQLTKLEPGMNKDQALAVFTGLYPYDILMGTDEGCEVHLYKYWKPSRKLLRANLQLDAYLTSGRKMYVKEADAFVFYKDGKIALVSTEGNKGKYINMLETHAADVKACAGPVKGCTDPTSLTFNPDATEDDGSCQFCECGLIANPDYDPNRAKSDCNQPCLPMDENGNPIRWTPTGASGANHAGDDCNLCDMIKAGEKVTLNINVNSEELNGKSTGGRAERMESKSGKSNSRLLKKDKKSKKNSESNSDKSTPKVGLIKPFSK